MKKIVSLMLVVVFATQMFACNKISGKKYTYYYTNTNKDELIAKEVVINSNDNEEIINKLIEKMSKKSRNKEEVVIKPDYISNPTIYITDNLVTLDYDKSYYDYDSYNEVLYRAAMVKEITAIEGIDGVRFMVDGSPLVKNGKEIPIMMRGDLVDDTDDDMQPIEWSNVTLFYANKSGDKLIRCQRTLPHNSNISIEKLIVESLITGPSQSGYYRTIPSDVRLLSLSVNDGICYVNFSEEFINEMVNAKSEIPIYSLTNSLCCVDEIRAVKILVDGDSSKLYRESISLDTVFEFKDDLVSN